MHFPGRIDVAANFPQGKMKFLQRNQLDSCTDPPPNVASLRHCIIAALHNCIIAPLHHCIIASLHNCMISPLHDCIVLPHPVLQQSTMGWFSVGQGHTVLVLLYALCMLVRRGLMTFTEVVHSSELFVANIYIYILYISCPSHVKINESILY